MSISYEHDTFIPLSLLAPKLDLSVDRLQEVARAQERVRRGLPAPRVTRRCLANHPPLVKVGGRLGCWLSDFERWRERQ